MSEAKTNNRILRGVVIGIFVGLLFIGLQLAGGVEWSALTPFERFETAALLLIGTWTLSRD